MVHVTYDDQIFVLQARGGISRYIIEVAKVLRTTPDWEATPELAFRYTLNDSLLESSLEGFRRPPLPAVARRPRIVRTLNRLRQGRRAPADVLHHTYYLRDALGAPARARVCSVHDMTPELFPDLFPYGNPHAAKREYVAACDAIFCISQSTKNDLLAEYGPLDKPVVVTPLGVSDRFFDPRPSRAFGDDFVLFVGLRETYKNFDVLLRAMVRLHASGTPVVVVCVGPPFTAAERVRLGELGLVDRVRQVDVGDEDLPSIYAAALCLVFPSRYEGFGLPTVEAFAAGCPVVLADMACAREVGGEAAQFFAPDDDEALAAVLEPLVKDPAARTPWIEAGRTRARDFTWRRTAGLTADVYRSL